MDFPGETYTRWFPKTKRLIIANREISGNSKEFIWSGRGSFTRIEEKGIKSFDVNNWWEYLYNEERDRLVYLLEDKICLFDFDNGNSQQWVDGENSCTELVSNWIPTHPSRMKMDDGKTAFCWNPMNGKITIIDLNHEKVIAKLQGFRFTGPALENIDARTIIGFDSEQPLYYVMRDINRVQVFNRKFLQESTLKFDENIIGLYQLDTNTHPIFLVTRREIYKLLDGKAIPIYGFKDKLSQVYLLRDGKNYSLVSDKEWVEIDAATLAVTSVKKTSKTLDSISRIISGHYKEKLMHVMSGP